MQTVCDSGRLRTRRRDDTARMRVCARHALYSVAAPGAPKDEPDADVQGTRPSAASRQRCFRDALHLAPAARLPRFSRPARANDALLRPSSERPANTRTPD
jgi:hypothetical protein